MNMSLNECKIETMKICEKKGWDKVPVENIWMYLTEEVGELAKAILEEDQNEFCDAIGDIVIVLTNLAHLGDDRIEDCISDAYKEIKNRKGSMQNGTFVKDNTYSKVLATKTNTL